MIIHHHSSSLFTGLSHLLASTCLYFPDLEVRDTARFHLRLLTCIPGKKLKHILRTGGSLPGISPSTHSASFFNNNTQSPHSLSNLKKSSTISSYMHIQRVTPSLVKQSWSLSLPNFSTSSDKPSFFQGIADPEPIVEEKDSEITIHRQKEPLRVMDAKISEIVGQLRRHFSCIPDYRHMQGLKIKIECSLRFESEPLLSDDGVEKLPALYATILKFTSSAQYGNISSFHIPFLLGTPPKKGERSSQTNDSSLLAIVPIDESKNNGHYSKEENFEARVCIELEPREPMPGLVDIFVEANSDNGQIIKGQLHGISVGIEDMFLRAILPDDVADADVASYYADLFDALWESCESSSSTGRETFVLKGGRGAAAISGTRSVKLLEVSAADLVRGVERHLAPFVVCVIGDQLVDMVKGGGVVKDVLWREYFNSDSELDVTRPPAGAVGAPLYLKYLGDEDEGGSHIPASRKNIGYFQVLIFLPPRFHLLFRMEIREFSTLVRIRTDHWPCLAYVDDYLEALFLD